MNLETVVTDRNDLVGEQEGQKSPFLFRSHPTGVAHLAEIGFNLVSAANNHSYGYGAEGVLETLRHLEALAEGAAERKESFWYAGIGANREDASRPRTFRFRGARVAFPALGIVTNMVRAHRAGDDKPGTLGYCFE